MNILLLVSHIKHIKEDTMQSTSFERKFEIDILFN